MTADTFSSTLGVALMATGNDNNTWGTVANSSVFQIFEDAAVNWLTEAVTGGTLDLSGSAPPAGPSQVRYARITFTGVLGSNQTVIVPNLTKFWSIVNSTTGAFTLSMKTPSGVSFLVPRNGNQIVFCNGADTVNVSPYNSLQAFMFDGSVTAPPFSNVNETNSGWYRAGTQDWRLSVNGIDALQVTGASASSPYAHNVLGYGGFGPLVPPGAEMSYPGITAPTGWVFEFGQAVSRPIANGGSVDTYKGVWNALTTTVVGSTNSNTSVTGLASDMRFKGLGKAFVEGTGITLGTTITFTGATTATLSIAAGSSTPGATLRILPFGQGDGSTTFNIPDRRDVTLFGRGDMNGASDKGNITVAGGNFDGTQLGISRVAGDSNGGGQNVTIAQNQLPNVTLTATGTAIVTGTTLFNYASTGGQAGVQSINAGTVNSTTSSINGGVTQQTSPNMPPAGITNWILKL